MIELLGSQVIPEIATAAGFAAGVAAERLAIDRASAERQSLVEAWALDDESAPETPQSPSVFARAAQHAGRIITPLSVSMALAAGLTAEAWLPLHERSHQQTPAPLEIVVDHSGATVLSQGDTAPITEINKVVKQFENTKQVKPDVTVAGGGVLRHVDINKVADHQGLGDAPLESGLKLALDDAGLHSKPARVQGEQATEAKRSAGVVVLTNGNEIGDSSDIVAQAHQNGDLPVFVVNVEAESDSATTHDLRAIARRTGGKYWDASAANVGQVARDVQQTIVPAGHESDQPLLGNEASDFLKFLSLLGLAGVTLGFIKRSKTPFQRNFRGE